MSFSHHVIRPGVVIVAGPTGVGKDSIVREIIAQCEGCVELITATTRKRRENEGQGEYHFFTNEVFDKALASGEIPEHWTHPSGARYGTYLPYLTEQLGKGKVIIGDMNIVGARYMKENHRALTLFILPPDFSVLRERIIKRGRHDLSEKEIDARLRLAQQEIAEHSPWYDYRVINRENQLDTAVQEVLEILTKEGYCVSDV
ncbi:MAG: hypothetical protein AAB421_00545 [Patescibacteria group bacterium]